jgi:hypothetical protein
MGSWSWHPPFLKGIHDVITCLQIFYIIQSSQRLRLNPTFSLLHDTNKRQKQRDWGLLKGVRVYKSLKNEVCSPVGRWCRSVRAWKELGLSSLTQDVKLSSNRGDVGGDKWGRFFCLPVESFPKQCLMIFRVPGEVTWVCG